MESLRYDWETISRQLFIPIILSLYSIAAVIVFECLLMNDMLIPVGRVTLSQLSKLSFWLFIGFSGFFLHLVQTKCFNITVNLYLARNGCMSLKKSSFHDNKVKIFSSSIKHFISDTLTFNPAE